MKKSLKRILSLFLVTALTTAAFSFFGIFHTAYVFGDPTPSPTPIQPIQPIIPSGEPLVELPIKQLQVYDALQLYEESMQLDKTVNAAAVIQSLARFGSLAGAFVSAAHAGIVLLQMTGVMKDPTATELSKILSMTTDIQTQLQEMDDELKGISSELISLAVAEEERDRQSQTTTLSIAWNDFNYDYVNPLKKHVMEYQSLLNNAIQDWWSEETHEGVRVLYTSLNDEIVPTYSTAPYDAGFPETATNGETVLLEYSFGLPSEYMPNTSLIKNQLNIDNYSEKLCTLFKTQIIAAVNDRKLDASEEFYTNWEALDDNGKEKKAESYAKDLLDSLIPRISKDAMTKNDSWVTEVKADYNLYCEHIRDKNSGLDALINMEYLTHGFEGETKDEITQIGYSMIATCGYFGTFVQSIMEQDTLQPAADLADLQNNWADTILYLNSKTEAALTGCDNFCYITHTLVDSDMMDISSDMTADYIANHTSTKKYSFNGLSYSDWEVTDSNGNSAENLSLVPNASAVVLYHTYMGQKTGDELFSAYLNRNGVSVEADHTGKFITNYKGIENFALDDGVYMEAHWAWYNNGRDVYENGESYNITDKRYSDKIDNKYFLLHDKVVADYLDTKTGTLSTNQILSARAGYFEGHWQWSTDQGWFFFKGDDWYQDPSPGDFTTMIMNTGYHMLTSTAVAVQSAATDSVQKPVYANVLSDGLNKAAAPELVIAENSPLLAFDRVSLLKETEPQKKPDPYSVAAWDKFYQENVLLVSVDDENYREFMAKVIDHAVDKYESQDHARALTKEAKEELTKAVFQKNSDLCAELRANSSLDVLDVFGINGDDEKELALAKAVLPDSYLDQNGDPEITAENMDTCAFYETGVRLDIETINKEACALLKPTFFVRPELVIWDPVLEEFAVFQIPKDVIKELGLTMNVRLSAVSAKTKDAITVEHYDNEINMNLDKTSIEQIQGSGADQFVAFKDSECSIFVFQQESMVPLESGAQQWGKTVKTGDENHLVLWIILAAVAAGGAIGAVVIYRKKRAE